MFENLFKMISTKNLYFASLKKCITKKHISNKNFWLCGFSYGFEPIDQIILVKKIRKNYSEYYKDVFTKSIYKLNYDYCEIGEILINKTVPVNILSPYIKYDDVTKRLAELNSKDYENYNIKDGTKKPLQKIKKY